MKIVQVRRLGHKAELDASDKCNFNRLGTWTVSYKKQQPKNNNFQLTVRTIIGVYG